jgi:hypothetical protein
MGLVDRHILDARGAFAGHLGNDPIDEGKGIAVGQ